jgi:hypothetical protein
MCELSTQTHVASKPSFRIASHNSGNGKDNNVIVEKVPGPTPIKPLTSALTKTGGQSHKGHK